MDARWMLARTSWLWSAFHEEYPHIVCPHSICSRCLTILSSEVFNETFEEHHREHLGEHAWRASSWNLPKSTKICHQLPETPYQQRSSTKDHLGLKNSSRHLSTSGSLMRSPSNSSNSKTMDFSEVIWLLFILDIKARSMQVQKATTAALRPTESHWSIEHIDGQSAVLTV